MTARQPGFFFFFLKSSTVKGSAPLHAVNRWVAACTSPENTVAVGKKGAFVVALMKEHIFPFFVHYWCSTMWKHFPLVTGTEKVKKKKHPAASSYKSPGYWCSFSRHEGKNWTSNAAPTSVYGSLLGFSRVYKGVFKVLIKWPNSCITFSEPGCMRRSDNDSRQPWMNPNCLFFTSWQPL